MAMASEASVPTTPFSTRGSVSFAFTQKLGFGGQLCAGSPSYGVCVGEVDARYSLLTTSNHKYRYIRIGKESGTNNETNSYCSLSLFRNYLAFGSKEFRHDIHSSSLSNK